MSVDVLNFSSLALNLSNFRKMVVHTRYGLSPVPLLPSSSLAFSLCSTNQQKKKATVNLPKGDENRMGTDGQRWWWLDWIEACLFVCSVIGLIFSFFYFWRRKELDQIIDFFSQPHANFSPFASGRD